MVSVVLKTGERLSADSRQPIETIRHNIFQGHPKSGIRGLAWNYGDVIRFIPADDVREVLCRKV